MCVCQCPQRASTYFFLLVAHMDTVHKECVSMPSTGFYLFLLSAWMVLGCSRVSVNALNGLLLISSEMYKLFKFTTLGVNALNGLLLISSICLISEKNLHCCVSMPSTGFYLFLQKTEKREEICLKGVNALNGLLLISSKLLEDFNTAVNLCQCPQRASTYFFGIIQGIQQLLELCQCPQRASTYFF